MGVGLNLDKYVSIIKYVNKKKTFSSLFLTKCGNSFSTALIPPIINGTETIPHSDTLFDLDRADRTGLSSVT